MSPRLAVLRENFESVLEGLMIWLMLALVGLFGWVFALAWMGREISDTWWIYRQRLAKNHPPEPP